MHVLTITFALLFLTTALPSNRQPYFRFMILFKMNPDLCEEQAHEHWKTVHADLTLAMKGTGVLIERYVQFHADRAGRAAIQSLVDSGSVVSNSPVSLLVLVNTEEFDFG